MVIIYGFDSSYKEYYNKNIIEDNLDNQLYVALTRSKEHLYLIQHCDNSPLINNFVNLNLNVQIINLIDKSDTINMGKNKKI